VGWLTRESRYQDNGTPATQWGAYFAGSGPSDTSNYVQVIATDHVANHAIIPLMVTTGLSDFVSYRYDENGNLIERLSSEDGPTFYEWDHKNRLTKVTHPDGQETLYEYCPACPLGKLSKMTRKDGSTVEWTWDGLSMVEEADTREGDSAYFSGLALQRNGAWYYLFMDAMGSVFQVTDETGALVNEFDWDAWGNELSRTFGQPSAVCQMGWQGKRWDEEQGVFYSVARWYDPRIGRFTQPDPAEGEGVVAVGGEGYGWPETDPVGSKDPWGLYKADKDACCVVEAWIESTHEAMDLLVEAIGNEWGLIEYLAEEKKRGFKTVGLAGVGAVRPEERPDEINEALNRVERNIPYWMGRLGLTFGAGSISFVESFVVNLGDLEQACEDFWGYHYLGEWGAHVLMYNELRKLEDACKKRYPGCCGEEWRNKCCKED